MKKICFHVIKYYPSLGGTELLAKQVVDHIAENTDFDITVLTTPEQGRQKLAFNYKIDENMFLGGTDKYDLSVFFSDLWSPQLNNYNISSAKKNICVLNLDDTTYKSKNNFRTATENLKRFDLVLTFSKDGIVNQFLSDEKIKNKYIPNPSRDVLASNTVFNLRERLKLDNKKIGMYCAAYYRIKNQLYFLQTVNSSDELKNYNWIMIGNEADKHFHANCVTYAKRNNLKNVYFIASTTDMDKLDTLYKQVDFITLLSLGEGMPLTILEAISANKPVIHTPVGGTAGVLKEAKNCGIYAVEAPFYSSQDLALNISKALEYNGDLLRNIWEKEHKKEVVMKKYLDIINKYLG